MGSHCFRAVFSCPCLSTCNVCLSSGGFHYFLVPFIHLQVNLNSLGCNGVPGFTALLRSAGLCTLSNITGFFFFFHLVYILRTALSLSWHFKQTLCFTRPCLTFSKSLCKWFLQFLKIFANSLAIPESTPMMKAFSGLRSHYSASLNMYWLLN